MRASLAGIGREGLSEQVTLREDLDAKTQERSEGKHPRERGQQGHGSSGCDQLELCKDPKVDKGLQGVSDGERDRSRSL